MAGGGESFLKVILKNFDVLAGPVLSLVYPLYASIQAIESKSPLDDQQWLTYWVLYSMITLFELTFNRLIEWLPFWSYTKLIFIGWLVIPYFSGAAYVYEHFVRPVFVNPQNRTVNIWYVPRMKDIFSSSSNKREDILTAAEKYIQENGTDAFQDLITKGKADFPGECPVSRETISQGGSRENNFPGSGKLKAKKFLAKRFADRRKKPYSEPVFENEYFGHR